MVEGFDIKIAEGEFTPLIGHWSCSTSTVLTMAAGLNDISEGGVILDGREMVVAGPDRAFALSPALLLLDEPFGMLDSLMRWELQDVPTEVWSRTKLTAVCVTHDVDEAILLADRQEWLDLFEAHEDGASPSHDVLEAIKARQRMNGTAAAPPVPATGHLAA